MDPESVDLAVLAAALDEAFSSAAPRGYVTGRTVFRDELVRRYRWSEAEAERIVETMIQRGFLRYEGDATAAERTPAPWTVRPRV
jgi:hypothetical protein